MKFTNQFVKIAFLRVVNQIFVYKPACQFHCELLNFATNFQSSEHFSEKLIEIDCNMRETKFFDKILSKIRILLPGPMVM